MFELAKPAATDVVLALKQRADSDLSPLKIDLGAGVYRNERGQYHEYRAIAEAKKILNAQSPGHDYETPTGIPKYNTAAAKLIFGTTSEVLSRVSTVQTISGSGSVHLAAELLARLSSRKERSLPKVFYGAPGWGNYENIFRRAGFEIDQLPYYDLTRHVVDFEKYLQMIRSAPNESIIILQGCSQNPTCADLTREQWKTLADVMMERSQFPVFDVAYHGLADGLDEDAYSWRLFADMGFEMVVCQSFSKNMGLYGERVGALHVVCDIEEAVPSVQGELFHLIRSEYSTNPAYGARLVTVVLEDPRLRQDWEEELGEIRSRLNSIRAGLVRRFTQLQTPGDWTFLLREKGLFAILPLKPQDCRELSDKHHIYLVPTGRTNISGLSSENLELFCQVVNAAIRSDLQGSLPKIDQNESIGGLNSAKGIRVA